MKPFTKYLDEQLKEAVKKTESSELPVDNIVVPPLCPTCNGQKKVPMFDEYDGKLRGSTKCWDCNGGIFPGSWLDNY